MNKVLIFGSGGREHALAWKFSQSDLVEKVLVAPGNEGMLNSEKVFLSQETDFVALAQEFKPDLIVIGPENLICDGLADKLIAKGFNVFAPSAKAGRLESSKIFAKEIMKSADIPTASYKIANGLSEAQNVLKIWDIQSGVVIKADELAQGKGVVVTHLRDEAQKCIYDFLDNPKCSVKSKRLLFEEKLEGEELSSFFLCHQGVALYLGSARDYKRVFDNDEGPNTGGMGCFMASNLMSKKVQIQLEQIAKLVLKEMSNRDMPFTGVLFIGSMILDEKVKVLEFNVRFGDPETQTLMAALKTDLYTILTNLLQGRETEIEMHSHAVHVVLASKGYPSTGEHQMLLGQEINFDQKNVEGNLFFAGVKKECTSDRLLNIGGRVLGVSVVGDNLEHCRKTVYKSIESIHFEGRHFRKDIGSLRD